MVTDNLGIGFSDLIDTYDEFLGLDDPQTFPPPDEINNLIYIYLDYVPQTIPTTGILVGEVLPLETQDDDLKFGVGCENSGISYCTDKGVRLGTPPLTDAAHFTNMHLLFDAATALDIQMEGYADEFIDRFEDNVGGSYYHEGLCNRVRAHPAMRNAIKKFGAQLEAELAVVNYDISMVNPLLILRKDRPVFNTKYDLFHGFQILINDIERMDVERLGFTIDTQSGDWSGTFLFHVVDHFGLDKPDVLTYQWKVPLGSAFASWWRLQNMRGYQPFVNDIYIVAIIGGNVYD